MEPTEEFGTRAEFWVNLVRLGERPGLLCCEIPHCHILWASGSGICELGISELAPVTAQSSRVVFQL